MSWKESLVLIFDVIFDEFIKSGLVDFHFAIAEKQLLFVFQKKVRRHVLMLNHLRRLLQRNSLGMNTFFFFFSDGFDLLDILVEKMNILYIRVSKGYLIENRQFLG